MRISVWFAGAIGVGVVVGGSGVIGREMDTVLVVISLLSEDTSVVVSYDHGRNTPIQQAMVEFALGVSDEVDRGGGEYVWVVQDVGEGGWRANELLPLLRSADVVVAYVDGVALLNITSLIQRMALSGRRIVIFTPFAFLPPDTLNTWFSIVCPVSVLMELVFRRVAHSGERVLVVCGEEGEFSCERVAQVAKHSGRGQVCRVQYTPQLEKEIRAHRECLTDDSLQVVVAVSEITHLFYIMEVLRKLMANDEGFPAVCVHTLQPVHNTHEISLYTLTVERVNEYVSYGFIDSVVCQEYVRECLERNGFVPVTHAYALGRDVVRAITGGWRNVMAVGCGLRVRWLPGGAGVRHNGCVLVREYSNGGWKVVDVVCAGGQ